MVAKPADRDRPEVEPPNTRDSIQRHGSVVVDHRFRPGIDRSPRDPASEQRQQEQRSDDGERDSRDEEEQGGERAGAAEDGREQPRENAAAYRAVSGSSTNSVENGGR